MALAALSSNGDASGAVPIAPPRISIGISELRGKAGIVRFAVQSVGQNFGAPSS
jgi:hypothetical protein